MPRRHCLADRGWHAPKSEAGFRPEVEAAFAETGRGCFGLRADGAPTSRRRLSRLPGTWPKRLGPGAILGHIARGAAGAFGSDPSDRLVELIYALKAGHRQNGRFVNETGKTQAQIRKFKDAVAITLWMPPAERGSGGSLMGFPVIEAEDMPDYLHGLAVRSPFGDFRRGYLVVDRTGVRILRDPYSAKPMCCSTPPSAVGGRGAGIFEAIKASEIRRLIETPKLQTNPLPAFREEGSLHSRQNSGDRHDPDPERSAAGGAPVTLTELKAHLRHRCERRGPNCLGGLIRVARAHLEAVTGVALMSQGGSGWFNDDWPRGHV